MELNQVPETHWDPQYTPMTQPHFVEERTLLSARPVVPLEEIRSGGRSRSGLLLTGAIAISLLLGACTALAMVYMQQRRSQQPAAISSDATPQSGSDLATTPPSGPIEESAVVEKAAPSAAAGALLAASGTKPGQEKKAVILNGSNIENKRVATIPSSRVSRQNEVPVVVADIDEPEPQRNDRETRRDERREARRVRWEEIRQRRVNSGVDLFRIREIFEGRRRPE